MAAFDGWSTMDGDLFTAYTQRFGMVCSFTAPDLTAEQFNDLFRTALETGIEIDYVKAGWDDPESLEEDALI